MARFFGYTLGDESVSQPPPSNPNIETEMDAFVSEMMAAGVVLATGGIAPSAAGKKVALTNGEFTVTDGPFAEAKELVGGWALMECRDLDEAVEYSKRFLSVVGNGEVRVRQVFGPE
jgi:hypothetical protein